MEKDFDKWNEVKKSIDSQSVRRDLFFLDREIWWCSLGINIGVEENGKGGDSTRPVLIIKKFNNAMLWILPITTREGLIDYRQKITVESIPSWVCLSQLRTISTKRLIRKIATISEMEFDTILCRVVGYIKRNPSLREGNLGGRSH